MGEAELRVNQSRQTALDEGILSPKQEGEKICRQGLDNSGNIEALPIQDLYVHKYCLVLYNFLQVRLFYSCDYLIFLFRYPQQLFVVVKWVSDS